MNNRFVKFYSKSRKKKIERSYQHLAFLVRALSAKIFKGFVFPASEQVFN